MRKWNRVPFFGLALVAAMALPTVAFAQDSDEKAWSAERDGVTLLLQNNNWQDVRVYVISGTAVRRLGSVTGLTSDEFVLPRELNVTGHDLQFAISPIGSRGVHYSQRVVVTPGDIIDFRVANNLALSSLRVF